MIIFKFNQYVCLYLITYSRGLTLVAKTLNKKENLLICEDFNFIRGTSSFYLCAYYFFIVLIIKIPLIHLTIIEFDDRIIKKHRDVTYSIVAPHNSPLTIINTFTRHLLDPNLSDFNW